MTPETMTVKIKALCSVPRLGFNEHYGAMWDTLSKVGIPYGFYCGAYWDQGISQAFEDHLHLDLLLPCDYDTLATPQHLTRMIEVMCKNPHIDALAANQPRRGTGMPLWTIKGEEGETKIELEGPTKCHTAHFGFTLIRCSALRTLPKPWFPRVYAKDGTAYGEGYMDPDISFWVRWAEAGKTLYIEPSVTIGHLETMVSYFDQAEQPSINEQIEKKRAELDALENQKAACADPDEKILQLCQMFSTTSEWRKKFGGSKGMVSLGEKETR